MNKLQHHTIGWMAMALVLVSCGSMEPLTQVRDDVYFSPSQAPVMASTQEPLRPENPESMEIVEDYFDAGTSEQLGTSRSFYDVAYNDPFYYNQGRFGFGMGMGMGSMGWQSGWNGPGWGMGMGWGMGPSWGMNMGWGNSMGWGNPFGWYDPWCPFNPWSPWNRPMGWNNPWGWNRPWGWNDPWMMNGGWGMPGWGMGGWGMGNYWGPWGNCLNCYAPVIVGGSSNTYVGHRPSMGSANGRTGATGTTYQPRMPLRDPISLDPVRREAVERSNRPATRELPPAREVERGTPTIRPGQEQRLGTPRTMPDQRTSPQRTAPQQRTTSPRTSPERTAPRQERSVPSRSFDRGNSFDRGGGFDRGRSPSYSPGGGGRPSAPRPR